MRLFLLPIILSSIFSCCDHQKTEDQEFIDEDGLFIEVVDSLGDGKPNAYNRDNTIYLPEREFVFTYSFIDKEGRECWFSREGYGVKSKDSLTTKMITALSIEVQENNDFFDTDPDYNQTLLAYKYYLYNDSISWPLEHTGVIENAKNVWMHPWRRAKYFYYLQLNPYPFIKHPYEIGHSWDWGFKLGSQWGYKEWRTWEGNIDLQHHYEIVAKENISTPYKAEIPCYVIEATGDTQLGETRLTAYFNDELGFIKLQYINIDSTQMTIELKEIRGMDE